MQDSAPALAHALAGQAWQAAAVAPPLGFADPAGQRKAQAAAEVEPAGALSPLLQAVQLAAPAAAQASAPQVKQAEAVAPPLGLKEPAAQV